MDFHTKYGHFAPNMVIMPNLEMYTKYGHLYQIR